MKKIALTYDDGPSTYTLDLLEVLAKHNVGATFFMVGNRILDNPDIVKRVAAGGHWIGNHTMNHPKLSEIPADVVAMEIDRCSTILNEVLGFKCYSHMFRPPYLLCSQEVDCALVSRGLQKVMCTASGNDGGIARDVDFIVAKVKRELGNDSGIVLMHDGYYAGDRPRATTVVATDRLITYYKAEGYQFVSPLELNPAVMPAWWV